LHGRDGQRRDYRNSEQDFVTLFVALWLRIARCRKKIANVLIG